MEEIIYNTAAIVLAGGKGKRMGSDVPKQYMTVCGRPLLYYTLKAFEESFIEKVYVVCAKGDEKFCRQEFVEKYGFTKICGITCGGCERYHSVWQGLEYVKQQGGTEVVFIHDGARPFVDSGILHRCYEDAIKYGSGIAAVPSKDTVKLADADGFVKSTLKRENAYLMQTPQTFEFTGIYRAYEDLILKEDEIKKTGVMITDDAMVMEYFTDKNVKLSIGNYKNIKITTPEDLEYMEYAINKKSDR